MPEEKKEVEYKISKSEIKRGSSGMVMEENSLTVVGNNLKEVEKIFDKKWTNKN